MKIGGFEDALNRAYKVLFVPYALVFMIYAVFGIFISALLSLFGYPKDLAFLVFLTIILVGALVAIVRWLIRLMLMRTARLHTPNPFIKRITEADTLRFLSNDYVEYTTQIELRATAANVREMDFLISWQGKSDDINISNCHGCSVAIHDAVDHAGKVLRLTFPTSLPRNTNYPVGFTVLFDNKDGHLKPYLRKTGPYIAQDKINMTVILPEKSSEIFVQRIQKNSGDRKPVHEKFISGLTDSHSYSVVRPVQGFSYFLGIAERSE